MARPRHLFFAGFEYRLRALSEWTGEKPLVLLFSRRVLRDGAARLAGVGDIDERIEWLGAGLIAVSADAPEELAHLKKPFNCPSRCFPMPISRFRGRTASTNPDETDAGPQPHGEPGTFVLDRAGNLAFRNCKAGQSASSMKCCSC
jgi:hypothetical protein